MTKEALSDHQIFNYLYTKQTSSSSCF